MSSVAVEAAGPRGAELRVGRLLPVALAALGFAVLFWRPLEMLARDWWTDPEAGHGLLIAPLALWLAWRSGVVENARPQVRLGLVLLLGAVVLRYVAGLAGEWFTMRLSALLAGAALVIYWRGLPQLRRWWLPAILLLLSIPLPEMVVGTLALPLQLQASKLGAALLNWREVPVLLAGNVIHMPGRSLFVTEACSGLRSLTALVALGVLIGGMFLKHPVSRWAIVLAALPVAVLLNGLRVFLTGFLVYFVDPALGTGFMHMSEGWAVFVVAFLLLGGLAVLLVRIESRLGVEGRLS
ncbi:MAG TPA: exosortase/archaeosortase family protein [Longimicrobiales bacterium]